MTVWKNTGYYMLFFLAGLAGVPPELLDAAKIDGAGAWQRFRNVTLPMLGPTLAFVLVIAMLNVLTQVDHVVVMTQGGPSDATTRAAVLHLPAGASELRSRVWPRPRRWSASPFLLVLSLISLRTPGSRAAL